MFELSTVKNIVRYSSAISSNPFGRTRADFLHSMLYKYALYELGALNLCFYVSEKDHYDLYLMTRGIYPPMEYSKYGRYFFCCTKKHYKWSWKLNKAVRL